MKLMPSARRETLGGGTAVHDTVVNQLLAKLYGVEQLNNVLLIVRYMKAMELHWQCQKVITHLTNLRRFMQSHNYDDKDLLKMEQLLSESCDQFLSNLADCMETMGIQSKSGGSTSELLVADSSITTPNSVPQSIPHATPDSIPQSMPCASLSSLVSDQPPPLDRAVEPLSETSSTFDAPDSNSTHHTPAIDSTMVPTPVIVTALTSLNPSVKPHIPMLDSSITHHEQVADDSSCTDQGPTSLIAQESFHEEIITTTSTVTTSSNTVTSSALTFTNVTTVLPHQQRQHCNTFFSKLEHKFSDVLFLLNDGISTDQFLKACEDTLSSACSVLQHSLL